MMVEVRCCCTPTKLLGYLDVRDDLVRQGNVVGFAVCSPVDTWQTTADLEAIRFERVDLPIEKFWKTDVSATTGWTTNLAFKSEETPIETLRRIPGFVEATP